MDEFMAMAKDYAKAEKELEVQHWAYIGIERLDDNGNRTLLCSYDLPRELYDRKRWVIRWRKARLQCKHPRDTINTYCSFYDKRLGNDAKVTADLRMLVSAKAQLSRARRKIDEYVAWHMVNDMFFDEKKDPDLMKAREKLAVKRAAVQAAEERLKIKIKQIQDEQGI